MMPISRTVEDILDSHGHAHVSAGDVESARERFADERFDYVILDLDLPAKPGRFPRLDNGRILLEHLRGIPRHARTPVIVITGRGREVEQVVSVMKAGNSDFTEYLLKPLDGGKLDKAILDAVKRTNVAALSSAPPPVASADAPPVSFDAEPRELMIFDDRITVCDVELWSDHAQSDLREALVHLSARDGAGYVRIRGEKLGKLLKRDQSNPIARPIKDFRDRATEKLRSIGIACGRDDIIRTNGGYQLTKVVTVRTVRGSEARQAHEPASLRNELAEAHERNEPPKAHEPHPFARHEPAEEQHEPAATNGELNERQRWVLSQLADGVPLQFLDITRHTKKKRATINRDLKGLRDMGLIDRHPSGHYIACRPMPPRAGSS